MLQLLLERTLYYQVSSKSKKLVLLLATSTLIIRTRLEAVEIVETAETVETVETFETAGVGKNGKKNEGEYPKNLARVLCIRYNITFQKKSVLVLALFDSNSKVNVIYPIFAKELSLSVK